MIGGAENAPRNGFYVTDAAYNTRSSIRRVSEHHIVPAEVCDGQGPARSTSCGCDVGVTLRHPQRKKLLGSSQSFYTRWKAFGRPDRPRAAGHDGPEQNTDKRQADRTDRTDRDPTAFFNAHTLALRAHAQQASKGQQHWAFRDLIHTATAPCHKSVPDPDLGV